MQLPNGAAGVCGGRGAAGVCGGRMVVRGVRLPNGAAVCDAIEWRCRACGCLMALRLRACAAAEWRCRACGDRMALRTPCGRGVLYSRMVTRVNCVS